MKSLLSIFLVTLCSLIAEEKQVFGPASGHKPASHPFSGRASPDTQPWLGVSLSPPDPALAAQLRNIPLYFGLIVREVEEGSPAALAGIQAHDVIWKVDDQLIANKGQLYSLLTLYEVGSSVSLVLSRKGEVQTVSLTLASRPLPPVPQDVSFLQSPPPGLPLRQIDHTSLTGFITQGEKTVRLKKRPEGYFYKITNQTETETEGLLTSAEESTWPTDFDPLTRQKLRVLILSLNKSPQDIRSRVPRVRRVSNSGSSQQVPNE